MSSSEVESILGINQSGYQKISSAKTNTSANKKHPIVICFLVLSTVLLGIVVIGLSVAFYFTFGGLHKQKKSFILVIPDGMSPSMTTLTRVAQFLKTGKMNLEIDADVVGTVRTYSSNSWVTDSASSATAYASCIKTYNKAIGVNRHFQPVITIGEAAKLAGYKTGLVVSSRITHATPAAFSAHVVDRNLEFDIASQQITRSFDVLFGGGRDFFLPLGSVGGGRRTDGVNLIQVAKEKFKYNYISTLEELQNATNLPLLGLFSPDHLSYLIDRDSKKYLEEPTLAQMTAKALELLQDAVEEDQESKGFFLMVEASRIDHALHENDASSALYEALEFDETWALIRNFVNLPEQMQTHHQIAIVAVADHETGGLTLGREVRPWTNASRPDNDTIYAYYPGYLWNATHSAYYSRGQILEGGMSIQETIWQNYGINATAEQIQKIRNTINENVNDIARPISDLSLINWSTPGHSGGDVNLYTLADGPPDVYKSLRGNKENIDVCKTIVAFLGIQKFMNQPPPPL